MFRLRRFTGSVLSVALVTVGSVVWSASPAAAFTTRNISATTRAYTDQLQPTVSHVNSSDGVHVGAWRDGNGVDHVSRVYFTFALPQLAGATFNRARASSSYATSFNCSRPSNLEAWITADFTAPTWDDPPTETVLSDPTGTNQGCPFSGVSWDLLPAVTAGIAAGAPTISIELRVAGGNETDPAFARALGSVSLQLGYNRAPDIPVDLTLDNEACGTATAPLYLRVDQPTARARLTDPDLATPATPRNDPVKATFAFWPVDDPSQRQEFVSSLMTTPAVASRALPTPLVEGVTYAVSARATDDDNVSSTWTDPCYVVVDLTAPVNAPTVGSTDYPPTGYPGTGGPGIPGAIHFTAGDPDVAGFAWAFYPQTPYRYVPADTLGGTGTLTFTPDQPNAQHITVVSVDRAGNRSPQTSYEFYVHSTAPTIIDGNPDGAFDTPRQLTLRPNADNVTEYRYQVNGGAEQSVAAGSDGTAIITVTPDAPGDYPVIVSSISANGYRSPAQTLVLHPRTAPSITSEQFPSGPTPGAVVGVEGEFKITPAIANLVSYTYQFDSDAPVTIPADVDGKATIHWTPSSSGWHWLTVTGTTSGGLVTDATTYSFVVSNGAPVVISPEYPLLQWGGGPGVTGHFTFTPRTPNVVSYVYRFSTDGVEHTIAAGPDGTATITWTPTRPGEVSMSAWSHSADGTVSEEGGTWFFVNGLSPTVTSDVFAMGGGGAVGVPGTVLFSNNLPGATDFVYTLDNDPEQTVTIGDTGSTLITVTPPSAGYHWIYVYSRRPDGLVSTVAFFQFIV